MYEYIFFSNFFGTLLCHVLFENCILYYLRIDSCIADLAFSRIIVEFGGCSWAPPSVITYSVNKIILVLSPDINAICWGESYLFDADLCIVSYMV
jgi:hypothetical protein